MLTEGRLRGRSAPADWRARESARRPARREARPSAPGWSQTFKLSASRAPRHIAFGPLSAVFPSLAVASCPG